MEKQRINTTQAEAQWINQATNYQQLHVQRMGERNVYERAQKDFDELTWRHKAYNLQNNGKNGHKIKKSRQHNTMRQPTPPKDSNRHAVPPEGDNRRIAHLLSATGLCYKENKLILPKNLESFVLHGNIRGVVWPGEEVRSRTWEKRNLQLGSRDYSRMLQRSAAVTGDDGPFRWWVSAAAALIGRRSPSPPRSCWPCVGWSGSRPPRACWCLRGETGRQGRGDRGHCVKKLNSSPQTTPPPPPLPRLHKRNNNT